MRTGCFYRGKSVLLWQIARERVREVPSIVGADVTGLLRAWSQGDPGAAEKLVPLVYDDLKRRAARYLRQKPTADAGEARPVEPVGRSSTRS